MIKPALAAEEWSIWLGTMSTVLPSGTELDRMQSEKLEITRGEHTVLLRADDLAPIAALALHGQPFGFTREDALFVRTAALRAEHRNIRDGLVSLAARIEALLPPLENS